MNVYVESNFVLELGLLQHESPSCEEILRLCEEGLIRLILPSYSLIEPYETIARKQKQRLRIKRDLDTELTQIARTQTHQSQLRGFEDITTLLVNAANADTERLNEIRSRLIETADVISVDATILGSAEEHERTKNLAPQDALIYSAVLWHHDQTQAPENCFLSRDRKDFDASAIVDQLAQHRCKLLPSFDSGRDYILHALA